MPLTAGPLSLSLSLVPSLMSCNARTQLRHPAAAACALCAPDVFCLLLKRVMHLRA
jgi:hypothetical protein